jgi:hypothetical protein
MKVMSGHAIPRTWVTNCNLQRCTAVLNTIVFAMSWPGDDVDVVALFGHGFDLATMREHLRFLDPKLNKSVRGLVASKLAETL